ncbi:MAG TPA: lysophospholipid acyltransferase family protein [Candidatus Polarisedimenticolia bacterium]|nr:lysophospholipid acyltransferase family protein [Candidatus Polarisedimenticolia bacterium]
MNPARELLEYLPVRAAAALLRLLPRRAALACGRGAGLAAWALDGRHRRVARENLRLAFGKSLSEAERRRLVRRVFSHFGMVAADCLTMTRLRPQDVDRLIEYEGVEHIRRAFLKGKGVFVFSGHFGNWEMVALMQGWLGYPMAMVTRPLDNPRLDRLLREARAHSGNDVIAKRQAARAILRALRHGWCVAIVIDQDARGGGDPVFVDFFGRPAATTPALALLALKTGAPIVPVFGVPLPGGRHRITYLPEVAVERTGDRDADVLAITQRCTSLIEEQVRSRPECWLWLHQRWKRRPRAGRARGGGAGALEKEGA